MAIETPANGVATTLASGITSGATTCYLTSATGFTNNQYHCLITDNVNFEVVEFTGLSSNLATMQRAVETYGGSATASTFAAGSQIIVVTSVQSVQNMISQYNGSAGKNVIINGGMDIWQRGTSFPLTNTQIYTADRWSTSGSATSIATVSQVAAPALTGFGKALRVQRNSGASATANISIGQSLESLNSIPLAGQTVTFSFWARIGANFSGASNEITAYLVYGTGIDQNFQNGSYTGQTSIVNQSPVLTTTWQYFSYSGVVGATATELALEFYYGPVGTAGANDYFDITGVQLELGNTASIFSRAGGDIQGELAKCQRYCYEMNSAQASDGYAIYSGSVQCIATTNAIAIITFPTTMRIAPSFTSSVATGLTTQSANGTGAALSAIALDRSTPNNAELALTCAAVLVAGNSSLLFSNGNNTSYLAFSAEL
jgi:hypothetical protein